MALIQCLLGPAQTTIGSTTYNFVRDEHQRFVCNVPSLVHVQCLVSCGSYAVAGDIVQAPLTEAQPEPAAGAAEPEPEASDIVPAAETPAPAAEPAAEPEGEAAEPAAETPSAENETDDTEAQPEPEPATAEPEDATVATARRGRRRRS